MINLFCLEQILFFNNQLFSEKKLTKKISGKTILITGASFGIGASIVYKLANYNTNLILVARTEQKLQNMKKIIEKKGSSAQIFPTNLYNIDEVDKLIENIKKHNLKIDFFINNAGKSIKRSIFDELHRFDDFTRTMAINYFAPVKLMLFLIPMFMKNKGQVINISAVNVLFLPFPKWAAYQASKTAFDNWFRAVMPELNAYKIKTSSIYLPLVRTRMIIPNKKYRKMPAMTSKQVTNIVCKAICKNKKNYAPWWTVFIQLYSVIFRNISEKILNLTIKN